MANVTPPPKRIAHIAVHGMGVHAPFAGIATLLEMFLKIDKELSVRYGTELHGSETLTFAEFESDGAIHRIYEMFYSPIPKGHATLGDILRFIWNAISNFLNSITNRKLWRLVFGNRSKMNTVYRWVFGERRAFPLRRESWLLLYGLAVSLTLLVTALVLPMLCAFGLAVGNSFIARSTLTLSGICVVPLILGGLCSFFAWLILGIRPSARTAKNALFLILGVVAIAGIGCTIFAIGFAIISASNSQHIHEFNPDHDLQRAIVGCLAGALFLVATYVSNALVDSIGDVVTYVSESKASEFHTVREDVQAHARARLATILEQSDDVRIYAHSLGSAVAYDAINRALLEDPQNKSKFGLFLTYGSPLGLIAFVFQYQAGAENPDRRQQLASTRQPMLEESVRSVIPWVNIYAPLDVFSPSPLTFFNAGLEPHPANVINLQDANSRLIGIAHVQYTKHPCFCEWLMQLSVLNQTITTSQLTPSDPRRS